MTKNNAQGKENLRLSLIKKTKMKKKKRARETLPEDHEEICYQKEKIPTTIL